MPKYTLTIKYPDGATETRDFADATVTVGRKNADITLPDDSVSSKHGELHFAAGDLTFVDVGSSNGSWLPGGRRIEQPLTLEEGGVVLLGRCSLTVEEIDRPDDDRTAMLSADEIAKVLGQQAAPAPSSAQPTSPQKPLPSPHQPAQRPQAHQPAPAHQPAAHQPAQRPQAHQPAPAHQPAAHQSAAHQPAAHNPGQHQPIQPKPVQPSQPIQPKPHHAAPSAAASQHPGAHQPQPRAPQPAGYPPADAGYPDEDEAWADEPADWAPPAGGAPPRAEPQAPPRAESHAPPPSGGPRPPQGRGTASPPPRGDESFGAIGKLLPEGIKEAIAVFKEWKQRPQVGWPQVQEALYGGWGLLENHLMTAPLPMIAVGGFAAIFAILMLLLPSLAFLYSIASLIASVASLVAYAATFLFLLRAYVGAPMTLEQAIRRTIADPKTLLVSLLAAGVVAFIGAIVVLIPGIVLGAFIFPAFWIEGRRMLGLNERSLDLFRKDGKRILLTLLAYGVGAAIVNTVVSMILGFIPFIGPYLSIIVGVVISGVLGAYSMALTLWLYFDIRATHETGDPSADAMRNTQ